MPQTPPRRTGRPLWLPWALSLALWLDFDDAHAELERLLGQQALEEGQEEDYVAVGLSIHRSLTRRRRAAFRGKVRSFLRLGSLTILFSLIWLVHSGDVPPQYFETISIHSVVERYSLRPVCPDRPTVEPEAAPPVSPQVGGRVRREDLPAAKMRDLTFDKETPDMLHPITPQDVGRISGEGRPEMKLQDCWAKPAPEN